MSTLFVDSIEPKTTNNSINAKGMVIKVDQSVKKDTFTANSSSAPIGSEILIPGITINITPVSVNSKVLISWSLSCGHNGDTGHSYLFLMRDSTKILLGNTEGSRTSATQVVNSNQIGEMSQVSGQYLDSPNTTSQITYSFKVACTSSESVGFSVNRATRDNNATNFDGRATSTITVQEIGG
jgi:hypothetical protein